MEKYIISQQNNINKLDLLVVDTEGHDYERRTLRIEGKKQVLQAEVEEHWIILTSSRREMDRKVTEDWLHSEGVPYHALLLDKTPYDLLTDDKTSR